jgi:deoxyribodipyrimidine photo-lyase
VAGTSPDAAPWFRVFNPDTQAGKFDPAGTYRDQYASPASSAQVTPMVDLKASRERALAAYGSVATNTIQNLALSTGVTSPGGVK